MTEAEQEINMDVLANTSECSPTSRDEFDQEISSISSTESDQDFKCVLVTGGAGFIGSHVAEILLLRGDKVVIVDELNDYYDVRMKRENLSMLTSKFPRSVVVYEGDICDQGLMQSIFEKESLTHVCHLAARAGVRPSIQDPFIYIHSNIEGTTRLLELSRSFGIQCFVYASSSSVYGGSTKDVFSEDDVVDHPVSPYAASKKACELMAYTYSHLYGLNTSGLRFFTVYGPRGRPDMAPFKFIDRVSRGVEIQQFGDGNTERDYTYIDDIADGVVRAIDRPLGYQIFNLGNSNPVSLKNFIEIVQECVGKRAVIQVMPEQPGDVPRTCANTTKAEVLLGYCPKVGFREGMRLTVEWYKVAVASNKLDHAPEYGTYGGLCRSMSSMSLHRVNTSSPRSRCSRKVATVDIASNCIGRAVTSPEDSSYSPESTTM